VAVKFPLYVVPPHESVVLDVVPENGWMVPAVSVYVYEFVVAVDVQLPEVTVL
jgi:hypothetical protein